MQILHIVPGTKQSVGGIARDAIALADALIAAGEQCVVIPSPASDDGEFQNQLGDAVGNSDIVHLHGLFTPENKAAGATARRLGKPFVLTPHNAMLPLAWQKARWKKLTAGLMYENKNLRTASCLHALCGDESSTMQAFNSQVQTISLGVNVGDFQNVAEPASLVSKFPQLGSAKWVLVLGRIDLDRGIVPAMQACFDVLAKADGWHLVVAGPDVSGIGTMLQAAVGRKGLTERVTFAGLLSPEDARAAVARSSLLLQPSIAEGPSMAIIDALAAGKPVIISDACCMPEVSPAGAGKIVPPVRPAIAAALREIVGMGESGLQEMGQRAKALAREKYDWSKLIPEYQRMYQQAASARS